MQQGIITTQEPTQPSEQNFYLNDQITSLAYYVQQEILCPELLPYRLNISKENPKSLQEQLKEQQDAIQGIKEDLRESKNKQRDMQFLTLHVIEFERVKYLYQLYLRVRIKKISENAFYYYNEVRDKEMSIKEREFMKSLVKNQIEYLQTMCLKFYPNKMRDIGIELRSENTQPTQEDKDKKSVNQPNLKKYVFVKCKVQALIKEVLFQAGEIGLVCYEDVRDLMDINFMLI